MRRLRELSRREERGRGDAARLQIRRPRRSPVAPSCRPIGPLLGEEGGQQGGALGGSDAPGHLDLVVEAGVSAEVVEGPARTGPRVGFPEDDPLHPRRRRRTGTHRGMARGSRRGSTRTGANHPRCWRHRAAPGSRRPRWGRPHLRARCGGPPPASPRSRRRHRPEPHPPRRRPAPRPRQAPWRLRRSAGSSGWLRCPSMRGQRGPERNSGRPPP